jgi:hypothetical protein
MQMIASASPLARADLVDVPSSVQMTGFLLKWGGLQSCRRTYPAVWWWLTEQFRHPAQVLYGGCQQELIMCTAHTTQA